MHEVRQHFREIDGNNVPTYMENICSANIIQVEAGSTGYCGGDSGH